MEYEGPIPLIEAGSYPPQLLEACKAWAVRPEALLDWSVGKYSVAIVLPSGQKARFSTSGTWGGEPGSGKAGKPGRTGRGSKTGKAGSGRPEDAER